MFLRVAPYRQRHPDGTTPTRCSTWPNLLMQRTLDPPGRPLPQAPVCLKRRSSQRYALANTPCRTKAVLVLYTALP
jgi:hypothetical protein